MFIKPKGTKDLFNKEAKLFELIRETFFEVSNQFNFHYIETPIFESSEIFTRSSGEFSDIVNKEMYTFQDKSNRNLTLKPEGTAPFIRAYVENKLYADNTNNKFFYYTPCFRYEQPQKGRQRQFTQAGIEFISNKNPFNDLEVILFADKFLKKLKIKDFKLVINCIGDKETRLNYSNKLKEYFQNYKHLLEKKSLERLENNPLRILDDKIESQKDFVKNAPKIFDFLSEESKQYFDKIIELLKDNIEFEIDYSLVRGLDYYDDFVFEFVSLSLALGSQSTILAGGRYNNLIFEFGGPDLSAIGFASGVERLFEIISFNNNLNIKNVKADFYIASFSEQEILENLKLINKLRDNEFNIEWNKTPAKIKNIFKNAEKMAHAIIFKEINQDSDHLTLKTFNTQEKKVISLQELFELKKG